eukprot:NODE_604_length_6199_cov_0.403115.p1 type:complete len:517 gc:universal NODE_604_length_6199_cov_0.403115:3373-4923(+)
MLLNKNSPIFFQEDSQMSEGIQNSLNYSESTYISDFTRAFENRLASGKSFYGANLSYNLIKEYISKLEESCSSFDIVAPSLSLFGSNWSECQFMKSSRIVLPNPNSPVIPLLHPNPNELVCHLSKFITNQKQPCTVHLTNCSFYHGIYKFISDDFTDVIVVDYFLKKSSVNSPIQWIRVANSITPTTSMCSVLQIKYEQEIKDILDLYSEEYIIPKRDMDALLTLFTVEKAYEIARIAKSKQLPVKYAVFRMNRLENKVKGLNPNRLQELGYKIEIPKGKKFQQILSNTVTAAFRTAPHPLEQDVNSYLEFKTKNSNLQYNQVPFQLDENCIIFNSSSDISSFDFTKFDLKNNEKLFFHGTQSSQGIGILNNSEICRIGKCTGDYGSGFYMTPAIDVAIRYATVIASTRYFIFVYKVIWTNDDIHTVNEQTFEESSKSLSFNQDFYGNEEDEAIGYQRSAINALAIFGPTSHMDAPPLENQSWIDVDLGMQLCVKSDSWLESNCARLKALTFTDQQ